MNAADFPVPPQIATAHACSRELVELGRNPLQPGFGRMRGIARLIGDREAPLLSAEVTYP